MDSNHRLVLFTHALYRLSYPAVFFAMWLVRPDEAGSVSGSLRSVCFEIGRCVLSDYSGQLWL